MNSRSYVSLMLLTAIIACSTAEVSKSHSLAKRQAPPARGSRTFPLSRSRQFPPPEEDPEASDAGSEEEDSEYDSPSDEDLPPGRGFRGRQQPPTDEDYHYTEAPITTTPVPPKTPNRASTFNNRPSRPRFGAQARVTTTSTTSAAPRATSAASSRFRGRSSSAPTQRIDTAAENKAPPPRSRSIATSSRNSNSRESVRKPLLDDTNSPAPATRRVSTGRVRARGKPRTRSTTTTTTTTTTTPAPEEDYYYYYYDEDESAEKRPLATTTSTTTTTTTKRPSLPRRGSLGRGRPAASNSRTVAKPKAPVKFDPESQFAPPPEEVPLLPETLDTTRVTKRFTTSTTEAPGPGGIPAHLKGKYKPRTDGRFIDYLRDPNRPRELKGFDLTDYPFYITVPEDIEFECDDKKDGYYASVPHHCQLFHYCFAGARYDFLCANYTLYDQTTFTCRFANNVDCPSSAKYFYRNDDLWKETPTTLAPSPEPKRKAITPKDDDDEDDYEYDDEEYEDDDDDTKRRRRPSRRRRNRRRKNKAKSTTETP